MKKYRIVIQYDGSRFQGWQRQVSTENTIQGKIEAVLSKLCGTPVEIDGAGRTDAGVHAMAQIASFHMECDKTPEEIRDYMNFYLPEDIVVKEVCVAEPRFHARLNATGKHYRYRVRTSEIPDVFDRRYVYSYTAPLDVEEMRKACEALSGTHDFRSFTSNHRIKKSTVRSIHISLTQTDEEIVLDYTGDGFLYHMVRILTGTILEVGSGEKNVKDLPAILAGKERSLAGGLVPAKGLMLMEVYY